MFQSSVIPITDKTTHHFFVVFADSFEPALVDTEGRIMVYLDRKKATDAAYTKHKGKAFATVGMGDEKWERFQREQKFIVVED